MFKPKTCLNGVIYATCYKYVTVLHMHNVTHQIFLLKLPWEGGGVNILKFSNKTFVHFSASTFMVSYLHNFFAHSNGAIWGVLSEQHQHQSTKNSTIFKLFLLF